MLVPEENVMDVAGMVGAIQAVTAALGDLEAPLEGGANSPPRQSWLIFLSNVIFYQSILLYLQFLYVLFHMSL